MNIDALLTTAEPLPPLPAWVGGLALALFALAWAAGAPGPDEGSPGLWPPPYHELQDHAF